MPYSLPSLTLAGALLFAGQASAVTLLSDGSDLNAPASWSNGLPSAGNEGTIDVSSATNSQTVFGFGADSVTNLVGGTITADDGFNLLGAGTWNMSGGKIITRYFLANGQTGPTIFNMSGGEIELKSDSSNFISTANGGILNISGSALLNAATGAAQSMSDPNDDINFSADWTGQWSVGSFTDDSWKDLFTTDPSMKYDGAHIDGTTFDSLFTVSDGGQSLALANPIPEPSTLSLAGLVVLGWAIRRKR